MSAERVATPESLDHLYAEISALVNFEHDGGGSGYEQSADAMWKAAALAFNYVARSVGATGFQASWAALRFYGEVMGIEGPFGVYKIEDALYPQYDLPGRLRDSIAENRDWLREQASALLEKNADNAFVAPSVRRHWQQLADS